VDGTSVTPYVLPPRSALVSSATSQTFDMVIIGGGATGAGVALDAATRGLKVCCIERSDFAAGTSGRSTKLIHGGIRYLQEAFQKLDYGKYELVKEALTERNHMLQCAPYMNQPLPIMIPLYNSIPFLSLLKVPYYLIGAKVYDQVAGASSLVPSSHFINQKEAMYQFPMLKSKDLLGAIVYYDGQMNDTRMCLHLILTAVQSGATALSRVNVTSVKKTSEGKVCGVEAIDEVTGEKIAISAKVVVNATGPFADAVRKMADDDAKDIILPAAGVHVVLPDHFSPSKMGLIIPETEDGRVLFFLPWEGATVAGTTDSVGELTMEPTPTDEEVGFIVEEANKYLQHDKAVTTKDIKAAWSGIRPLVRDPSKPDSKSVSRTHVLEVSPSNLVTIAGGKWTTYRQMAEDTVDKCLEAFPSLKKNRLLKPCSTLNLGLIGSDRAGVVSNRKFDKILVTLREEYNMPKDVAAHLVSNYGTRALQIAELATNGLCKDIAETRYGHKRLVAKYPFLEAECVFAARQEYALSVVDVLARRTRLAFIDSKAAENVAGRVAELMGNELGWSRSKKAAEVVEAKRWLVNMNMKGEH
jgi:glycerol-3-phosphate dehydrogenase